tara:strand:- start:22 stop:312 length:291 start_codon:yes stop_codon:yes gene_type:complete
MSVQELDDMTPKSFANAQIGMAKLYEQTQQAEWERARWISCVIINPHLKRPISPGKITKFPWEHKKSKIKKVDIDRLIKESEFDDKVQKLNKKKNA